MKPAAQPLLGLESEKVLDWRTGRDFIRSQIYISMSSAFAFVYVLMRAYINMRRSRITTHCMKHVSPGVCHQYQARRKPLVLGHSESDGRAV